MELSVELVSVSPARAVVVPSIWCSGRRLGGFRYDGAVFTCELPVAAIPLAASLRLDFWKPSRSAGGEASGAAATATLWLANGTCEVVVPSRLSLAAEPPSGWLLKLSGGNLAHCFARLQRLPAGEHLRWFGSAAPMDEGGDEPTGGTAGAAPRLKGLAEAALSGWLHKRTWRPFMQRHQNKWRPRFFVLAGKRLLYSGSELAALQAARELSGAALQPDAVKQKLTVTVDGAAAGDGSTSAAVTVLPMTPRCEVRCP